MIAFVDESIKRGLFSVGVYISRGNDRVLRDFLVRLTVIFCAVMV